MSTDAPVEHTTPDRPDASDITFHDRPSTQALEYARMVNQRVGGRSAPVRYSFISRNGSGDPAPPLARMLRGGRGGEVRLKLYLSILWFAGAPPFDVTYPARAWAGLLDLPDIDGRGARRIHDAVGWLVTNGFLTRVKNPGRPDQLFLLREDGSGREYIHPGPEHSARGAERADWVPWVALEPQFWLNGWLAVLSPAAVAMYLVLRMQARGAPSPIPELWLSQFKAREILALSPDTRSKGLRELEFHGLVTMQRRSIHPGDAFDWRRMRNVYRLLPGRVHQRVDHATVVSPIETE